MVYGEKATLHIIDAESLGLPVLLTIDMEIGESATHHFLSVRSRTNVQMSWPFVKQIEQSIDEWSQGLLESLIRESTLTRQVGVFAYC
jgi:hypothetical protein